MFVFLLINNISLCIACVWGVIVVLNDRYNSQILIFNSVIFAFSVFFSVLVVCFLKKIKKKSNDNEFNSLDNVSSKKKKKKEKLLFPTNNNNSNNLTNNSI